MRDELLELTSALKNQIISEKEARSGLYGKLYIKEFGCINIRAC